MASTDDQKIKTEDAVKGLLELMKNQDVSTVADKIIEYFDQQDRAEVNIGVAGRPRSGKCTFINAMRGLGNHKSNSARSGLRQTGGKCKGYAHPKYPTVRWWDLPGMKKVNFQADEYLERVELERYNFIIIITSGQFEECHSRLAEKLKEKGKAFCFVRSKIDAAINEEKKKGYYVIFTEEDLGKTLNTIRNNCISELSQFGTENPEVFLISCRDLGKYHLNLLQKKMESGLSAHERGLLLMSLPSITPEIIKKKKNVLGARIIRVSFLAACLAAVPVPGLCVAVDTAVLKREIQKYHCVFGLSKKLLKKRRDQSGQNMEDKNDVVKRCHDRKSIVALLGLLLSEESLESITKFVPILGSLAAATVSFVTVWKMLKNVLTDNANLAKSLLKPKD